MIFELQKKDFPKVLPLFNSISYHNAINSVIEGINKGRIWVDNANHPKTALVWDADRRYYISGDYSNDTFNKSLRKLFVETIFPESRREEKRQWTFYYPSEGWAKIFTDLLKDHYSMEDNRMYFLFE